MKTVKRMTQGKKKWKKKWIHVEHTKRKIKKERITLERRKEEKNKRKFPIIPILKNSNNSKNNSYNKKIKLSLNSITRRHILRERKWKRLQITQQIIRKKKEKIINHPGYQGIINMTVPASVCACVRAFVHSRWVIVRQSAVVSRASGNPSRSPSVNLF